ncbi:MAG: IPTL-CTERM sorting domain-containing protein [candidate division Zixibacteria bacterium]
MTQHTLSEWGMLILALLILAAGTVAVVRRRKAAIARTD